MDCQRVYINWYGAPWKLETIDDNPSSDSLNMATYRWNPWESPKVYKKSKWNPRQRTCWRLRLVQLWRNRFHRWITWSRFLWLLLYDCYYYNAWIKNKAVLRRRKGSLIPDATSVQLPNWRLPWWLGLLRRHVLTVVLYREWEWSSIQG